MFIWRHAGERISDFFVWHQTYPDISRIISWDSAKSTRET